LDCFRGEGFRVSADGIGECDEVFLGHVFISFYVYVFVSDNRSLAGATSSGQIKFEFIFSMPTTMRLRGSKQPLQR
jgi:hypothetical protein